MAREGRDNRPETEMIPDFAEGSRNPVDELQPLISGKCGLQTIPPWTPRWIDLHPS